MIIRDILQNDIVEDIDLYRKIRENYITLIKSVKEDYEPKLTFNEFYVKVIENFEGVDEDVNETNDKTLIERLFKAIKKVLYEELEYNDDYIEIISDVLKLEKIE
jgi:flagellar biosynthesis/type III secretory pathway protein FliH